MEECDSILRSLGPVEDEEGDQMRLDYMTKQLENLQKQYQVVGSEASVCMVKEGKWGTCEEPLGIRMPTLLGHTPS